MVTALILSGGNGTRLGGDIPKQYIKVNGKPIISYCIDTFLNHPMVDFIQITAANEWHELILKYIHSDKFKGFSHPGKTRQISIFNALKDIINYMYDDDYVIIHDAARPMLSDSIITECLLKAKECDGALPVLPMKDTVYLSEDGFAVTSLLERSKIFAGQAPESFRLGKYYKANIDLLPDKIFDINGSTEPAIMSGMNIAMFPGDENNFKITTKADLERFKNMVL